MTAPFHTAILSISRVPPILAAISKRIGPSASEVTAPAFRVAGF
jgi:hypothetical protein